VKHLVFSIGRALREMGDSSPIDRTRRHDVSDGRLDDAADETGAASHDVEAMR
jgi:hypothetical protein